MIFKWSWQTWNAQTDVWVEPIEVGYADCVRFIPRQGVPCRVPSNWFVMGQ